MSDQEEKKHLPIDPLAEDVEWIKNEKKPKDDDDGGGSGDLAVIATLDENGLFQGNSYAKILFELDVSMQEILQRQQYLQDMQSKTKDTAKDYYLSSEELDQYDDVGVELGGEEGAEQEGPELDQGPDRGRGMGNI